MNSFHAYAINPAKFTGNPAVQLNPTGATAFLNWLTSPAGQAKVAAYLSAGGDPPFLPDAAPSISSGAVPAKAAGGKKVTIKGSVANVVPGTPRLNGVVVRVIGTQGRSTFTAANGRTIGNGKFSISFKASRTAKYSVQTPQLTKIEIPTLSPVFGDLLASSTLQVGKMSVTGGVTMTKVKTASPKLTISGALAPQATAKGGKVTLLAGHPGAKLRPVSAKKVKVGATKYSDTWQLGKGTWRIQMRYSNAGVFAAGTSKVMRVTLR